MGYLRKKYYFLALRLKARLLNQVLKIKGTKSSSSKLHLGCGAVKIKSWLNVDVAGSDFDADFSAPLPWVNETFDRVVSQHVIEHLEINKELLPLLLELNRVTTKDAKLYFSFPDISRICNAYVKDKGQYLLERRQVRYPNFTLDGFPTSNIINDLFHQGGEHKNLFDLELITYIMHKSGFKSCVEISSSEFLALFPEFPDRNDSEVSLYVKVSK